jgi:hypothetical protein
VHHLLWDATFSWALSSKELGNAFLIFWGYNLFLLHKGKQIPHGSYDSPLCGV